MGAVHDIIGKVAFEFMESQVRPLPIEAVVGDRIANQAPVLIVLGVIVPRQVPHSEKTVVFADDRTVELDLDALPRPAGKEDGIVRMFSDLVQDARHVLP